MIRKGQFQGTEEQGKETVFCQKNKTGFLGCIQQPVEIYEASNIQLLTSRQGTKPGWCHCGLDFTKLGHEKQRNAQGSRTSEDYEIEAIHQRILFQEGDSALQCTEAMTLKEKAVKIFGVNVPEVMA